MVAAVFLKSTHTHVVNDDSLLHVGLAHSTPRHCCVRQPRYRSRRLSSLSASCCAHAALPARGCVGRAAVCIAIDRAHAPGREVSNDALRALTRSFDLELGLVSLPRAACAPPDGPARRRLRVLRLRAVVSVGRGLATRNEKHSCDRLVRACSLPLPRERGPLLSRKLEPAPDIQLSCRERSVAPRNGDDEGSCEPRDGSLRAVARDGWDDGGTTRGLDASTSTSSSSSCCCRVWSHALLLLSSRRRAADFTASKESRSSRCSSRVNP